jgi:DNA polymerase Ligase (LigD)
VEDHPLDYGDFEGTIPKGQYGGGTVQLWDRGTWKPEGNKSPEAALADGELKFMLDGKRLRGSWVLVRMKNDRTGGTRANWLLIKHHDDAARDGGGDAILAEDRSVASKVGRLRVNDRCPRVDTRFDRVGFDKLLTEPVNRRAVQLIKRFVGRGYRCGLLGRKPVGQCDPQFIRNVRPREAVNESLDALAQLRCGGLREGNRNDLTGGEALCKKKRRLTAPGASLNEVVL